MAQALKVFQYPFAEQHNVNVQTFRKLFGIPNQMSQAGLTEANPLAVNPVTIAYENALPVGDQTLEGLPGPVRVDHEKSRGGVRHNPQPHQYPVLMPGGFI